MPKRDAAYMAVQRESIAKAARSVLIHKGVRETTLRDICREAGISIGALYIHFETKEEVVVAACQLDVEGRSSAPPPRTWSEYLEGFAFGDTRVVGSVDSKRMRLSLQFVAELTQMERNPKGLATLYDAFWKEFSAALDELRRRGEISLPLGLERTVEIHLQLLAGSRYRLVSHRDLPAENVRAALEDALAVTAGRAKAISQRARGRKPTMRKPRRSQDSRG